VGGRMFSIVGQAPVMTAQVTHRVSDSAVDTVKVFETNVKPLQAAPVPSRFTF
jgi:protein-L-isoaspartate(D-aspartate) O-methyltransferase